MLTTFTKSWFDVNVGMMDWVVVELTSSFELKQKTGHDNMWATKS